MVIELKRNIEPEQLQEILKTAHKKKDLRQFLGKLKRNIDGLEYQKEARNEWN